LFGAGWVLAGLALLPPLLFSERAMLAYALGNWIGVNGWLAYIANGRQHAGLQTFLNSPRLQRLPTQTLFQWLTALSILPWLWLVWSNRGWANEFLPLAYTLLAWVLLVWGLRLRHRHWAYAAPWHTAAHLSTVGAIALAVIYRQQPVFTAVTLAAAVFHFAATWLMPRWRWPGLFVGGLLLPIGWLSGLEWLGVNSQLLLPVLAAMVLLYLIAAKLLEDLAGYKKSFTDPLETAAMLLAALVAVWGILNGAWYWSDDLALIWVAFAYIFLGASFLLYAWQHDNVGWGHLGIWTGVIAGGLLIKSLSRGSGRSAALAALLAVALIIAERGLHYYATQPQGTWRLWWRRAWRLYRQPLLTGGWAVSAITIGLALVRNLIISGGGLTRQSWSIVALFLITGLYALSANLYKKERFVWLASILVIAPWTLLANLRWYLGGRLAWEWYGGQWVVLGLVLLGIAVAIGRFPIHNSQFPIHNSQFPIPNSQFTILNSQFTILNYLPSSSPTFLSLSP
jgi:hypothetical protein